jgi:hypothetical protein
MPAKSIDIYQNKSLVIAVLILIQVCITYLIFREKKLYSKKNKYRILTKWANYLVKQ